ncbi:uncharacterized protein UMAG_05852 [Mycosarcoma maydis]|uniref:Uncharacterized protein n=1 Tax=Mycosarcoma maydis TaxID=5270 RepID=A0A0D1DQ75_MYCMD|nr:uncharacterized protein UMAG_05852 [Ustilago maydis 521]KIS66111.1 hypothetical protein UMAG_05852 [Ustilago maydis 521]|eukprot:XP_011392214.1 hypothetical protein UMAG_05852 [Ustilago maydis 521]
MAARPTIFLTASSTAPATWALFDAPHLLFLARLSAYISTHLSPPVSHTSAAWAVQQQPCSQKGAPTPPFSGFALHCSSVCHLHSASSCLAQDADWPSELNPGLVLARGRLCQFFHSEPFSNRRRVRSSPPVPDVISAALSTSSLHSIPPCSENRPAHRGNPDSGRAAWSSSPTPSSPNSSWPPLSGDSARVGSQGSPRSSLPSRALDCSTRPPLCAKSELEFITGNSHPNHTQLQIRHVALLLTSRRTLILDGATTQASGTALSRSLSPAQPVLLPFVAVNPLPPRGPTTAPPLLVIVFFLRSLQATAPSARFKITTSASLSHTRLSLDLDTSVDRRCEKTDAPSSTSYFCLLPPNSP